MKKEDLEYLKDVLEDITYWETCPDNYKQRLGVLIELISEELIELKKLRVTDVSGALPMSEIVDCGKDGRFKLCNVCGNAKRQ